VAWSQVGNFYSGKSAYRKSLFKNPQQKKHMIDVKNIWSAYERIIPFVRKTPLEYSMVLSELTHANVFLKMECWQHTGSFKPRGAFNCLQLLNNDQKRGGAYRGKSRYRSFICS